MSLPPRMDPQHLEFSPIELIHRNRALGSDPLAEEVGSDPFLQGLEALGHAPRSFAGATPAAEASPPIEAPTPLPRPRRQNVPRTSDVDVPSDITWLERLIDPDELRHVAALAHMVEGETGYDRFGLSHDTLRRSFPFFYALYRLYFRVRSQGHEHMPCDGPAVLASNHAGLLPFDGAMIAVDTMLNTDPPRLPRSVVDRWAGSLPFVNIFYARVGQVIGTRENVSDLLSDGQLLLVFPEGMAGASKTITQRYRLQHFHVGFIEQALMHGAPVVPTAVIGSDDQMPILYDARQLAHKLGLPSLPITPTFPWFGPLGLLPYPVGYRIVYGEPFCFHQQYGPDDADDPRLVRYLAGQVRSSVQHLIDRHR